MSNLFNSIFNDTTATADPIQLFLALLVSLILGLALTWAYKHRTLYTREFAVSLTLLPCLMTLVIFLVNGSLGTSIAVAGTFSLIRFRSATSGSRELIAIFLAMIIGLASGTGYLALAILLTVFILAVWLLLEKQQSKSNHQRRRLLTITIANQENQLQTIQSGLAQFCTELDLISIDTSNDGEQVTTVYEVDFKAQTDDFQIINYLTKEQDTYQVSLTKNAKKRKNLQTRISNIIWTNTPFEKKSVTQSITKGMITTFLNTYYHAFYNENIYTLIKLYSSKISSNHVSFALPQICY